MYLTLAEATEYFDQYRIITDAWTDADYREQEVAIRIAGEIIDALPLKGAKVSESQPHAFPRTFEEPLADESTKACAEIAYSLLDGVDPEREYASLDVQSTRFANVSTTYAKNRLHMLACGIPNYIAWKYLVPWIMTPQTIQRRKG